MARLTHLPRLGYIVVILVFLHQVLAQSDYLFDGNIPNYGNNSTLLDVHVRFFNDLLQKDPKTNVLEVKGPLASKIFRNGTAIELETLLTETVDKSDWKHALYLMNEFASKTQNITVKYIALKVLWQNLKAEKLLYDPDYVIDLYTTFKNLTNNEKCKPKELQSLKLEIRNQLIQRCAQLLEVPLHISNYNNNNNNSNDICNNELNYPVVRYLLKQINQLDEDIFEEVLNITFDAVELLENKENVSQRLNCLGLDANQRLIVHLIYVQRNDDLQTQLFDKMQQLLNKCDMSKLPLKYLKQISFYLPESLKALHNASAICIRNITGNFGYLSECSQTTLMCTYPSSYKYRSVFNVEHLLGNKYTFHSTFWNRYIKLETNYTNGQVGSIGPMQVPAFIKNVSGSSAPSVWQAVFVGNNIALMDINMRQYLCGGNTAIWTKSEQYAYTRRAEDFLLYQNECLWFIEDCSYMI